MLLFVTNALLTIGLALGGLLTGYMIGGSATPVIGAVLPGLFCRAGQRVICHLPESF
jgi:hypothetical protein